MNPYKFLFTAPDGTQYTRWGIQMEQDALEKHALSLEEMYKDHIVLLRRRLKYSDVYAVHDWID